jgi:hypothetical protein
VFGVLVGGLVWWWRGRHRDKGTSEQDRDTSR